MAINAEMIRTFLALELPESLRVKLREVLKRYSQATPLGINWVHPENLHLTVLFIGDVPEHLIKSIDARLQEILENSGEFKFKAEGLELFPSREPRLLWLKLSAQDQRLMQLNRSLVKELQELGAEPDNKPLKLHITLARLKTPMPEAMARELLQLPFGGAAESYSEMRLYRSVLSPSGPKYSVLNTYQL